MPDDLDLKGLAKRARETREERDMTQKQVAAKTGVKTQTIQHIEYANTKNPTCIAELAIALGVQAEWLKTGTGPKYPPSQRMSVVAACVTPYDVDEGAAAPSDENFALIPQYTANGSCGPGSLNDHVEVKGGLAFRRAWLRQRRLVPENLVVVTAEGDSMSPTVGHGAVVLIDKSQQQPVSGRVYAFQIDGELRIKRLVKSATGGWLLRSDSMDQRRYPEEAIGDSDLERMTIVGRVVWQGGDDGL